MELRIVEGGLKMYWLDNGSAVTAGEMIRLIATNLRHLDKNDPAFTEQIELLEDIAMDIEKGV